jgi:hypothetical protein
MKGTRHQMDICQGEEVMSSIHNRRNAKADQFVERRQAVVAAMKPGLQWDNQKLMYFVLIMLAGMIVWAFLFGAVHHNWK